MRGGWVSELNPKFSSVEQIDCEFREYSCLTRDWLLDASLMLCLRVERTGWRGVKAGLDVQSS